MSNRAEDRLAALLDGFIGQAEEDQAITKAMNLAPRLAAMLAELGDPAKVVEQLKAEGFTSVQIQIARDCLQSQKNAPAYLPFAQDRHKVRLQNWVRNNAEPRREPDMYVLPVEDKTQAQLEAVDILPPSEGGDDGAGT